MKSRETFIGETMFPNQKTGREFLVKFFVNSGYPHQCMEHGRTAVYRLEIYNHIFEPQGSEYYCVDCVPPIPITYHD